MEDGNDHSLRCVGQAPEATLNFGVKRSAVKLLGTLGALSVFESRVCSITFRTHYARFERTILAFCNLLKERARVTVILLAHAAMKAAMCMSIRRSDEIGSFVTLAG